MNQFEPEVTKEEAYTLPEIQSGEVEQETTRDLGINPAVQQWLAKIRRDTHRDKIKFFGFFFLLEACLIVPAFSFCVMLLLHIRFDTPFSVPIIAVLGIMFLTLLGTGLAGLFWFRFLWKQPSWNAEEMTRVGGVHAVGGLIDLLSVPKLRNNRTSVYAALTKLLPQMKASDAALLNGSQRGGLHRLLRYGAVTSKDPLPDLEFRLAILKALEQIGDAAAIPAVEHLANGYAYSANQKALKAAAQECLPLLRANFGSVEANKTLLRASSAENAAPETLLRASEPAPDTKPEELLRAADSGVS